MAGFWCGTCRCDSWPQCWSHRSNVKDAHSGAHKEAVCRGMHAKEDWNSLALSAIFIQKTAAVTATSDVATVCMQMTLQIALSSGSVSRPRCPYFGLHVKVSPGLSRFVASQNPATFCPGFCVLAPGPRRPEEWASPPGSGGPVDQDCPMKISGNFINFYPPQKPNFRPLGRASLSW